MVCTVEVKEILEDRICCQHPNGRIVIYMREEALERLDAEGRMYRGADEVGRFVVGESRQITVAILRYEPNPFRKLLIHI